MELKPLLKAKECVKACSNILDQHLAFLERVYRRLQTLSLLKYTPNPKPMLSSRLTFSSSSQNTLKKQITRQKSSFSINGGILTDVLAAKND